MYNTAKDIGIKPAAGLQVPALPDKPQVEAVENMPGILTTIYISTSYYLLEKTLKNSCNFLTEGLTEKILTSLELASRQTGLNTVVDVDSVPTTPRQKRECSIRLTPQQMHQVHFVKINETLSDPRTKIY